MAELAGLVLGVAAALVPAYEGYQKCNTIIAETRNFPRGFRTFKQSLLTQRLIFNNEYELLLKEIVLDNTILQRMLKDQNHEHWIDPNFQKAFCSYFGVVSLDDKLTPFKVIREVLDEITHEVLELERRVESIPNSTTGGLFVPLVGASRRVRNLAYKFDWASSKKARLEGLVEKLRGQNRDLFQLRTQRFQCRTKLKSRDPLQQSKIIQRASPEYVTIREASTKLYKALVETATCHCHSINLRLDGQHQGLNTRTDSLQFHDPIAYPRDRFSFRVVLTADAIEPNQNISQDGCTCLLVESGPEAIRLLANPSPGSDGGFVVSYESEKSTAQNRPERKLTKKVQWATEMSGVDAGPLDTRSVDILNPVITPPHMVLDAIEDLCAFLKKIDIGVGHAKCLGYVKGDDSYSHLVYKDFPETLPVSRISLSCILSSLNFPEKQKLLPRGDRLKLGLALSVSVLYFGSYTNSWFKERWRSQDIYFFGNLKQQGAQSIGSPHVATSFNSSREDGLPGSSPVDDDDGLHLQKAGTSLARNEQLFSLAIVLMEIAYGDLLCNIFEGRDQESGEPKRLDEFAEYLKAKMVSDFIGREMGKRYADVVKRCLYCDFGIDESDLSKRKLQDVFFTNVICELERCVREFLA